jgi:pyrroline-5-carboxylate reductase
MSYKITIIGGGNLGTSIAKGLIKSGLFRIDEILLTEKREHRIKILESKGFVVGTNNVKAVEESPMVLICVKPQHILSVLEEIKSPLKEGKLLMYTVTGTMISTIEKTVGKIPIIRIMPNTAVEICESMTCVTLANVTTIQEEEVMGILRKLGKTVVIDEELMPAATVLGACGIAFALRFMRAATQGGIEIGFGSEMSQLITAQTIKGATELILENGEHPEREIDKVTTPQGITISGLNEMEHQGFSSALIKGLLASYNKLMSVKTNKS